MGHICPIGRSGVAVVIKTITNSCLLFFVDHSVLVSLLLLMSLIWNVCILIACNRVKRSEQFFEISAI